MTTTHIVVMGVAGSGKSSVGTSLSTILNYEFAEGDSFHPQQNIDKMSAGTPLTDEDRWPWLDRIAIWTRQQAHNGCSTVVTCSALKRSYRDILRAAANQTIFVHLKGSQQLLAQRMANRSGHFMPTALLGSQFATLEDLDGDEPGFSVDVVDDIDTIVRRVVVGIQTRTEGQS